ELTLQKLDETYKMVESELEVAKKVQRGLFPHLLPNITNLEIAGGFIAADKVSGDMYDVIPIKDNKTVLFIFDVSGHGISSALIGVMAKMLVVQYIKSCERPSEIFQRVNHDICQYLKTGHYITAFLGVINHSDNTMIYCQAGRVMPLFYRHSQRQTSFIKGNSVFLGHVALSDIAEFHDDIVTFEWNDKLVLYTDGITEAMNENDQLYGTQRLAKIVKRTASRSPHELLQKLIADNTLFRGGRQLSDDFTLLCIQFGCSEHILEMSGFTKGDHPDMLTFNTHEEIEDICSIIMSKLDQKGYSNKIIYQTHQCLHEILDNAIQHGNKFNQNKKVIVLYVIHLDYYCLSIIDEGSGFNPGIIPDSLDLKGMARSHGKGLYIIKHFMDEVSFNEKGNRIMIKKYQHPELKDGNRIG
ncbi:MAG: SpoIIE family protein phosphatase, partial [Chitinivibrionales bacterium]|nr:SpoIIE family protein phosphatase [Chitinivibrionales bacterium]